MDDHAAPRDVPNPHAAELFRHKLAVLAEVGIPVAKNVSILDYGCGPGDTVLAIVNGGYDHAVGYDIRNYLGKYVDRNRYFFDASGHLPFPDNQFDFVISDQVFEHVLDQDLAFKEIFRVLKPGGVSLHSIPAKYCLLEPHLRVPVGYLLQRRWWYTMWALLGFRPPSMPNATWRQTVERNLRYSKVGLKYLTDGEYRRMWKRIGFEFKFVEDVYMRTSRSRRTLQLAKVAAIFPPLHWLIRQTWERVPLLRKPA